MRAGRGENRGLGVGIFGFGRGVPWNGQLFHVEQFEKAGMTGVLAVFDGEKHGGRRSFLRCYGRWETVEFCRDGDGESS